ncbi:MAG: NAD(P)H-dependent oxidoreductase [Actinomycetota bacterium]|nr:NAD(P)H-dependent oxidoreductase [Actinomycetota bacterium]
MAVTELTAFALNCSLKPSPASSSSELLLSQVLTELSEHGVTGSMERVVDHSVKFGVTSDEGKGDDWPALRSKVLAADIFILGTPIWIGHPSSIAQQVLERMDAFLGETDEMGRMVSYGTVAGVAVVGNEDGAHHVTAQLYQGLADVGFTVPANAVTYWVGRAMQKTDYNDLEETPEETERATAMMARNIVHVARLLKEHPYPGDPDADYPKDQ